MPAYKLTYFNSKGKAEVTRLMFKLKGIDFEDTRITREEWPNLKTDTPFAALPLLETDGVKICQSQAIERLIAKRLGLYGSDDMKQAHCDMVVGCFDDMLQGLMKCNQGTDEEKKEKSKKFYEETVPTMLANLEKMVQAEGYFLGKDMMWPDIAMAHYLSYMKYESFDLGKYSKLASIKANVEKQPNIAAWIKIRPVTEF